MEGDVDVKCERKYGFIEFTDKINNLDVHFNAHIQFKNIQNDTSLYNYLFYVQVNPDNYLKFIKSFYTDGFVNAIPIFDKSLLNRSKTYISINLKEININNFISDLAKLSKEYKENNKVNEVNDFVFTNLLNLIIRMKDRYVDDIKDKVIFIDFRCALFNPHGIELVRSDSLANHTPLISSYNIAEYLKGNDIKLNFSDKGTGIYSASLSSEMFTVEGFLFRPIVGSYIRFDRYGLAASYMGSVFTPEEFENYTKLRILLDLEFTPKYGESLFSNIEDFEEFNKFIEKCKDIKSMQYMLRSFKVVSLSKMTIETEGTDAELFDKEKLAKMVLFSFIKSVGRLELISKVEKLDDYFKANFTFNNTNGKLIIKTNNVRDYDDLSFDIFGW